MNHVTQNVNTGAFSHGATHTGCPPSSQGFQRAGGASTLWMSHFVGYVIGIENDQNWFDRMANITTKLQIDVCWNIYNAFRVILSVFENVCYTF